MGIRSQAGNVIFFIMIAIALFAGLAYAVTDSMKSGGRGAEKEKSTITAARIIQYATELEQAVTRLKMTNDCQDAQISFQYGTDVSYNNTSSPSDYSCHVFNSAGGRVSWQEKPRGLPNEWVFSGSNSVYFVGTPAEGAIDCNTKTCTELVALLTNIPLDLCNEINRKTGIKTSTGAPPQDSNSYATTPFTGNYTRTDYIGDNTSTGGEFGISSKTSGCFESGTTGTYHFYHVLLIR